MENNVAYTALNSDHVPIFWGKFNIILNLLGFAGLPQQ